MMVHLSYVYIAERRNNKVNILFNAYYTSYYVLCNIQATNVTYPFNAHYTTIIYNYVAKTSLLKTLFNIQKMVAFKNITIIIIKK